MKTVIIILGAMNIAFFMLTGCGHGNKTASKEEEKNVSSILNKSSFDTTGLPSININEGWDKEQSLRAVYKNFQAYNAGAGYSKLKDKTSDENGLSNLNIYLTGEKKFEYDSVNYFLTLFTFLESDESGAPNGLVRAAGTTLGFAIFREFKGKYYLISSIPYYNAPGQGEPSFQWPAEILQIGENKLGIRVFLPVVGGQGYFQGYNSIISVDFNNNKMEPVAEIQLSSNDPENANLNYENDFTIDYNANISGFYNILVKDKSGNIVETYKYNPNSKKYEIKNIFEKINVDVHVPSQGG
jgi:hypothetical protein